MLSICFHCCIVNNQFIKTSQLERKLSDFFCPPKLFLTKVFVLNVLQNVNKSYDNNDMKIIMTELIVDLITQIIILVFLLK